MKWGLGQVQQQAKERLRHGEELRCALSTVLGHGQKGRAAKCARRGGECETQPAVRPSWNRHQLRRKLGLRVAWVWRCGSKG